MERGDYPKAEGLFRQELLKAPRSAEALSNLGAVLAHEEKFDDAVKAYREALRADPKLTPVYLNLGIAYFKAGKYEAALEPLGQFLRDSPGDYRGRQLLGVSLVEAGRFAQGIAELDQLNREKPNQPAVVFALASAHIREGDEARGKQLLEQLETMNLAPAPVRLLQGLLFYRAKLYEEAEKELQEALRLDPRSAATLAALGRLRLRVNDDPAAIALLERALAIQPQDAESHYQLGVLLSRDGKVAEGRKQLLVALEQRADYPDPMYFLGKFELSEGHAEAAVRYLERASRLAPHQENILFLLSRAYKQAGKPARANEALAEFRKLQNDRLERDRAAMDPEHPLDPTEPMASGNPQP